MLAIRLRRIGSKKRPFFRVVVTDSRTARDSSFVEVLGHYNPRTKPEPLELNRERLEHWVKPAPSRRIRCGRSWGACPPRRRRPGNSQHREPRT